MVYGSQPTEPAQWLVQMPRAEARHLAGTGGPAWPATPEARCVAALRGWLDGVTRSYRGTVPVAEIAADLTRILELAPVTAAPSRGPFGPRQNGRRPGRVEYLGDGVVRLDEEAMSALAELGEGDDFRAVCTDAGPMLLVGTDGYLAYEERPEQAPQQIARDSDCHRCQRKDELPRPWNAPLQNLDCGCENIAGPRGAANTGTVPGHQNLHGGSNG
jgi:hypothetical protein